MNRGIDEEKYFHIQIQLKKDENKEEININESIFVKTKDKKNAINEGIIPKNIKELINYFESIEQKQIEQEKQCYKNNAYLRLIYGIQFNIIYKYVKDYCMKKDIKKGKLFDEEIKYINKFITNNKIDKINYQLSIDKKDIYEIVDDYIKQLTKNIKEIDLEDTTEIKKKEFKLKSGFYPYNSPSKNW